MMEAHDEVNERGNNSKIIVFTETRHLKFVPGNGIGHVLSPVYTIQVLHPSLHSSFLNLCHILSEVFGDPGQILVVLGY